MPSLRDSLLCCAELNSKHFARFSTSAPQIMRTIHCSRFPGVTRARRAWLETPNELGTEFNSLTYMAERQALKFHAMTARDMTQPVTLPQLILVPRANSRCRHSRQSRLIVPIGSALVATWHLRTAEAKTSARLCSRRSIQSARGSFRECIMPLSL
jgi:hypothetical protein